MFCYQLYKSLSIDLVSFILEILLKMICSVFLFRFQLKMVLIKCCDISNEVRPMEVSEPWVDCLLEEYFNQVIGNYINLCLYY